jgi:tetratricopeptide (TPR) repeat protein
MSQNRVLQALFLAYISFFYRVFEEASRPEPALQQATGLQMMNETELEPIKRSSGPLAAKPNRKASYKLTRQEISEEDALSQWEFNDTETQVFEKALRAAAKIPEETMRGKYLTQVYRGLANAYSAQGKYLQGLHAMDLALGAAEAGQCPELQGQTHLALGQLELRHHRYYAAETRFDDAAKINAMTSFGSEDALAFQNGHGWAALMQGKSQKAEERFSTALELAEHINPTGSPEFLDPMATSSCYPRRDGHDLERAMSLLGLGLALRQRDNADVSKEAQMMQTLMTAAVKHEGGDNVAVPTTKSGAKDLDLFACAATLLAPRSSFGKTEPRTPVLWNALGYAQHLLGHHHDALELHRRAHELQLSHPGVRDLPAHSHTLLYLGLVKFSAGHTEQSTQHVQELLSSAAPSAEIAEWMVRFARAHTHGSAPQSDQDYGSFLFTQATEILKTIGVRRQIKHLIDFGRFLFGLRPSRLAEALKNLLKAAKLIDVSAREYPAKEQSALYNLIAAIMHRQGKVDEALDYFNQALSMDLYEAETTSEQVNYEKLMVSFANVGAIRLQRAGNHMGRWKAAVEDFRNGMSIARRSGLPASDPRVMSFTASYNNVMRLAHKQGVFQTCLGQLETLLYGPQCTSIEDDS